MPAAIRVPKVKRSTINVIGRAVTSAFVKSFFRIASNSFSVLALPKWSIMNSGLPRSTLSMAASGASIASFVFSASPGTS
jgi:hypothetical protein